ncbi:class I adenylate-forming enzyme family protein [Amycolatopsis sp. RTGN1]|uniref:class I adenylate-forming enzyme family protein n=1 Tax=Amycolatopsis ponsaeliensis TaxID=2992142 RepID=UPI00254C705D|nr:long-chain fatty acid--CoA ligase [Amycolatopsis sp. RTGN1]
MSATEPAAPGHYVARILGELAGDGYRPVLRWRDETFTAAELRYAVLRVASALHEAGAGPGDTVAILTAVNSPWMLVARYATHLLGAVVVHISGANHGTVTHELPVAARARMIRETGASFVVFDDANAERVGKIAALLPEQPHLCGVGRPIRDTVTVDGRPLGHYRMEFEPQAPECSTVIYTSGSTGRPKGVYKPFAAWNDLVLAGADEPKHFLVVSAASHTGGVLADVAIASGGSVLLRERFEPEPFLRDIEKYRITDTFIGVPLLYELAGHPAARSADLSSLRGLLYGGCPASPERVEQALAVFPGVLHYAYGTTEAGPIAMLPADGHGDPALRTTVGRPRPDIAVVIRDPETGREVPVGDVGEVTVRSPYGMRGYAADPELTEAVLRDGWVRTGDYGSFDDAGYLRLFGRMNDVVKVHDTKIAPTEVEKVLVGHPGVVDACVYGHRRADLVEELHAGVVLAADRPPGFDALRDHVSRHMTPTHAPVRFVRWRRFPVSTAGKVDRVAVRRANALVAAEDEGLVDA